MEEMKELLKVPCSFREGDYLTLHVDEDGELQIQIVEMDDGDIASVGRIVLSDEDALELAKTIAYEVCIGKEGR